MNGESATIIEDTLSHPLSELIFRYCGEYGKLRSENEDVSNLLFHRQHGLSLRVPSEWPVLDSIVEAIENSNFSRVLIVFSSTNCYREIYDRLSDSVKYLSWHEVYTGMQLASVDIRYVQRSKLMLADSDLTFFIDPPLTIPDVINQVQQFADGCMVLLSRGSECL